MNTHIYIYVCINRYTYIYRDKIIFAWATIDQSITSISNPFVNIDLENEEHKKAPSCQAIYLCLRLPRGIRFPQILRWVTSRRSATRTGSRSRCASWRWIPSAAPRGRGSVAGIARRCWWWRWWTRFLVAAGLRPWKTKGGLNDPPSMGVSIPPKLDALWG